MSLGFPTRHSDPGLRVYQQQEAPMKNQPHSAARRATITLIAAMLGVGLFASGVWAGSAGDGDGVKSASTVRARDSYWHFNARTGTPVGPAGQPDFWNYDPETGAKIADDSPGVKPNELAALWSVDP